MDRRGEKKGRTVRGNGLEYIGELRAVRVIRFPKEVLVRNVPFGT